MSVGVGSGVPVFVMVRGGSSSISFQVVATLILLACARGDTTVSASDRNFVTTMGRTFSAGGGGVGLVRARARAPETCAH